MPVIPPNENGSTLPKPVVSYPATRKIMPVTPAPTMPTRKPMPATKGANFAMSRGKKLGLAKKMNYASAARRKLGMKNA